MSAVPAAASSLRALRRRAGLSQEELAVRCGVSERTIRALESGRANRPHLDTLHSIARALDLGPSERANFVASWRGGLRALHELVAGPAAEATLRAEFDRQRTLLRDIAVSEHVRVDADRRWSSSTVRRTFEVTGEGLDQLLWLRSFAPELIDGARFDVVDCVNVEVCGVVDVPEWNAKAFRGSLRGPLAPGEVYSLEYTFDWRSAHRPEASAEIVETCALTGVVRPIHTAFVEVEFDLGCLPARVWSVSYETLDGEEQTGRELAVSRFGVAQLFVEPVPSGAQGIRWEWNRQD